MNTYKFELWNEHKLWYLNNDFHRDHDRPSWIGADGTKWWYQYGKYHRDNDKPAFIGYDGVIEYWVNGEKIK